jgi:hypothetical protein
MWGTLLACQALETCDTGRWHATVESAYRWLLETAAENTPDVAAQLVAAVRTDQRGITRRRLQQLHDAQNADGGWGPFAGKPSEAFDTALVLIAFGQLLSGDAQPEIGRAVRTSISRAQGFLVRMQQADGGWPETTRPAGRTSYPLRIATTAWVVEALWLTRSLAILAE